MNRKLLLASAVAIAAATPLLFIDRTEETPAQTFISPSDQALVARGKVVYDMHCAACHGANLEGQPNWRERRADGRLPAPPHDQSGHTWHHPDAVLVDIVKYGLVPGKTAPEGYVSDMPAYDKVLSDEDITAVLAYIKSTWPPEILELQKNVSLQRERH